MQDETVMDRLKQETRAVHRATERRPLSVAMVRSTIRLHQYIEYLWALRAVVAELEAAVDESPDPRLAAIRPAITPKRRWLEQDLATLGVLPTSQVLARASAVATQVWEEDAVGLIGWLYVLEGSSLGGQILAPRVGGAIGLEPRRPGLLYISGDERVRERWALFKDRVNANVATDALPELVEAATRAFDAVGLVLDLVWESTTARRTEPPFAEVR